MFRKYIEIFEFEAAVWDGTEEMLSVLKKRSPGNIATWLLKDTKLFASMSVFTKSGGSEMFAIPGDYLIFWRNGYMAVFSKEKFEERIKESYFFEGWTIDKTIKE